MKVTPFIIFFGIASCGWAVPVVVESAQPASTQGSFSMTKREHALGGYLQASDANRLFSYQQASRSGDNSQVASMVKMLDNPPHECYEYALPRILARLGATDALPIFDTYILDGTETTLSNMVKVEKSRLVAEDEVRSMTNGGSHAQVKIQSFLTGLGLTVADLNSSLVSYQQPEVNAQGRKVIKSQARTIPVGVAAVEEIADMAYYGSYQDYSTLPEISQINFQSYYPAALKMRLAPLSIQQRIATMIDDLSRKTILRGQDNYEIQLLANEGEPASQAAANKVQQMLVERSKFSGSGFGALIDVIACVGDVGQSPLVEQLQQDNNGTVANAAYLATLTIKQGSKRFMAPGY